MHFCRLVPGEHPAGAEGLWGTQREVPSFLYAMPVTKGRVFLEETCLVAKPPLPFNTLKRRLHRRLDAMGLKVQHPLLSRICHSRISSNPFLFIETLQWCMAYCHEKEGE